MSKPQQYRSLWTVLSKLPVFAALQSTVTLTNKLTPIIDKHLAHQIPLAPQEPSAYAHHKQNSAVQSVSLADHLLTISCTSANVATRLKHSQSSLLEKLNHCIANDEELAKQHGEDYSNQTISKLKITICSDSPTSNTASVANLQPTQRTSSLATVDLINSVSESVKTSELSQSLKQLAATLKKQQDQ